MSTEMLENLGAVRHALSNGDRDNAIDLLVDMRASASNQRPLDQNIARIRAGDLRDAQRWIERCLERAIAGVGDVFSDDLDPVTDGFEDIELDLDAEPADWDLASVDRGAKTEPGFGLDSFVSNASPSDSEIGKKSLTGAFQIPSPTDLKSKKSKLLQKLNRLKTESEASEEDLFDLGTAAFDVSSVVEPASPDSDPFASLAADFVSEPDSEEFDLGFENPNERLAEKSSINTREVDVDDADAFDFDLGFENPAERAESVRETKPNPASATKPRGETTSSERERDYTPLAQMSAIKNDIDDEFFALAESLASEPVDLAANSAGTTNTLGRRASFTHEEITGMHESSVSLVEDSVAHTGTNMSAILLEARRLYDAGEFEAALDITKKVLSRSDNDEAKMLRRTIEGELERKHLSAIGSLNKTPSISVPLSELSKLDLDHRAGFILSQIDGFMTFEDLIELSGMSRLETLEVLAGLLKTDVIAGS